MTPGRTAFPGRRGSWPRLRAPQAKALSGARPSRRRLRASALGRSVAAHGVGARGARRMASIRWKFRYSPVSSSATGSAQRTHATSAAAPTVRRVRPGPQRGDAEGPPRRGPEGDRQAGRGREQDAHRPGDLALEDEARGEHEQGQGAALAGREPRAREESHSERQHGHVRVPGGREHPEPPRLEKHGQEEGGDEGPRARREPARLPQEREKEHQVPHERSRRHGPGRSAHQHVDRGDRVEEARPGLVDVEARLRADALAALGGEARVDLDLRVVADLVRLEGRVGPSREREPEDRRNGERQRGQPGVHRAQQEPGGRAADRVEPSP